MKYPSIALILALSLILVTTHARAQSCPRPSQGLRINAVGDILVHKSLFEKAISQNDRFLGLWREIVPDLRDADITYGNLEGAVAPGTAGRGQSVRDPGFVYDTTVYSGTNFLFNYHPYLLDDLKESGFDVLSTANNHSLDRGPLGADRTIEELTRRNLLWTGTRHRQNAEATWHTVTTARGYNVAWIACTEMTNGMPDPHGQVLLCSSSVVTQLIERLSQSRNVSAVIVTPHWGPEYQTSATSGQKRKAREWAQAGATAIIGNHPHVLQPLEWLENGRGGQTLVAYSLGNFVAGQAALERRTSVILHVDLIPVGAGTLRVGQASYTPFYRLPPPNLTLRRLDRFTQPPDGAARYVRNVLGAPVCRN